MFRITYKLGIIERNLPFPNIFDTNEVYSKRCVDRRPVGAIRYNRAQFRKLTARESRFAQPGFNQAIGWLVIVCTRARYDLAPFYRKALGFADCDGA